MKTEHDEQELTRWLDGGMSQEEAARFEARLQGDPAWQAEAHVLLQLCADVKAHFPRLADVPHPDFFNSQVHERIHELELADMRARPVKSRSQASGSSGSDRPAPKLSVPSPLHTSCNWCACRARPARRTIMRSSVSLGWRASVSAWSA